MKATVVLFAYGGVLGPTAECWTRQLMGNPHYEYGLCYNAAALDRNRSMMASLFLSGDYGQVFVSLDHDMTWESGDIERIATQAQRLDAVVGGVYSKRALDKGTTTRLIEHQDYPIRQDVLLEAQYVSGGFMAIPRTVLTRISEDLPECEATNSAVEQYYPFFLPIVVDNEYLSEDWSLCERARQAGFGVYADCYPLLGHIGEFSYGVGASVRELVPA